jgi:phosphomannomutase/phosphoglucomutase
MLNPDIFRKYDIRGIVGKDLTEETVVEIGKGFGSFLIESTGKEDLKILISGDARESTPLFIDALTKGLNSLGISVINGGLLPTPVLYFGVFNLDVDGGIQVTGSHNPPEFNGFKMLAGKESLSGEEIQKIRDIIENKKYSIGNTNFHNTKKDVLTLYKQYFKDNFSSDTGKGLKVVVDAGNGISGPSSPDIFRQLGAFVVELFTEVDGTFPNHHPDPTEEKNMQDLIKKVLEEKADLGIAFDGDGDRIGAVDDKGRIIWGDQLLTIFSLAILKERKQGTFIGEVKCSQTMYDEIEKAGGNAIMYKTGHSLIKKKMKEEKALLAGEMSGHIFFADRYFGFDDATYAGARLIEIVKKENKKLSEIFDKLPKMTSTPEMKVKCADDKKFKLIENMKQAIENKTYNLEGLKKLITIDGLRMIFDNGWGLIRASNTTPVLVLRFEAKDEQNLKAIETKVRNMLERFLNQ